MRPPSRAWCSRAVGPSVVVIGITAPVQSRAKRTYEALLTAAQDILEESGYDGLNSNAVAERAGLTPPSFYRYFADKHMVLGVLAERLLSAQEELAETVLEPVDESFQSSVDGIERMMLADIERTRSFTAGRELLVLMRALPELRELRLATHHRMSRKLADLTRDVYYRHLSPSQVRIRTRLATELYFSTLELLFATGFRDQAETVRRAAVAVEAAISLPGES